MEYTINDLVKLSGISVRTLHYYDEIGLFVPSIRMANGRRYYSKNQLIRLMHILSLKDLGFSLKKIHSLLSKTPADNTIALKVQKEILLKEINQLQFRNAIIDVIISNYKGVYNMDMSEQEIKNNFSLLMSRKEIAKFFDENYAREKGKEYEDVYRSQLGEGKWKEHQEKIMQTNVKDALELGAESGQVAAALINAYANHAKEDSEEIQQLIAKALESQRKFMPDSISKKDCLCLRDQLTGWDFKNLQAKCSEKEFEELKKYHTFLYKAWTIFAEKNFPQE